MEGVPEQTYYPPTAPHHGERQKTRRPVLQAVRDVRNGIAWERLHLLSKENRETCEGFGRSCAGHTMAKKGSIRWWTQCRRLVQGTRKPIRPRRRPIAGAVDPSSPCRLVNATPQTKYRDKQTARPLLPDRRVDHRFSPRFVSVGIFGQHLGFPSPSLHANVPDVQTAGSGPQMPVPSGSRISPSGHGPGSSPQPSLQTI